VEPKRFAGLFAADGLFSIQFVIKIDWRTVRKAAVSISHRVTSNLEAFFVTAYMFFRHALFVFRAPNTRRRESSSKGRGVRAGRILIIIENT